MKTTKSKLLVILGAGGSVFCCMLSVRIVDNRLREWSRERACFKYFDELWKRVEAYYGLGSFLHGL